MIDVKDLKKLAKNGAILPMLKSGEIDSTEVDLSSLSDIERFESFEHIQTLNQWIAPEWSKLDSDVKYSEKQGGYYRCNFRKAAHVVEFKNEINSQFESLVKGINKEPLGNYLVKLIRDNFVLSILILGFTAVGFEYFLGINELTKIFIGE